jgi:DNA-binding response OmpR family regulator
MGGKVLLVSDSTDSGQFWAHVLRYNHLLTVFVEPLGQLITRWDEVIPDVILIDVSTTSADVFDLCRKLRAESVTPTILLVPTSDEAFLLKAYEAGVDECVAKPVSAMLLLAKVRSWMRRSWTLPTDALEPLKSGGFHLDPKNRQVVVHDMEAVRLTNLELRVLHLLMGHPKQTLSQDTIIDRVWGPGGGDTGMLKNVVYRLRRKIEQDPSHPACVLTAAGGYTFDPL